MALKDIFLCINIGENFTSHSEIIYHFGQVPCYGHKIIPIFLNCIQKSWYMSKQDRILCDRGILFPRQVDAQPNLQNPQDFLAVMGPSPMASDIMKDGGSWCMCCKEVRIDLSCPLGPHNGYQYNSSESVG